MADTDGDRVDVPGGASEVSRLSSEGLWSAFRANWELLGGHPSALAPLGAGLLFVGFALTLAKLLHIQEMNLPGLNKWAFGLRFGGPSEQIHRLLWGASALLLAASFVVAAVVSVAQLRGLILTRDSWAIRVITPIPVTICLLIVAGVLIGPGSRFAPGTLGPFHDLMSDQPGIHTARLTTIGNAWVAVTCVLLAWTLVYLLIPPESPSVAELRQRTERVRTLFLVAVAVFVVGLIEISLLHSWPSTVADEAWAQSIRRMALATSVAGGVFFGGLLVAMFGPAFLILRRQARALARTELGSSVPGEWLHRWIEESGLAPTSWQRTWSAVGVVAPLLSATSVTSLVNAIAIVVGG